MIIITRILKKGLQGIIAMSLSAALLYAVLMLLWLGIVLVSGEGFSDGPRGSCPHYPDCSSQ